MIKTWTLVILFANTYGGIEKVEFEDFTSKAECVQFFNNETDGLYPVYSGKKKIGYEGTVLSAFCTDRKVR